MRFDKHRLWPLFCYLSVVRRRSEERTNTKNFDTRSHTRGKIKYFLQKREPPQTLFARDDIFSRLVSLNTQGETFPFSLTSQNVTSSQNRGSSKPELPKSPSLARRGLLIISFSIFIYIYIFPDFMQAVSISKTFLLKDKLLHCDVSSMK